VKAEGENLDEYWKDKESTIELKRRMRMRFNQMRVSIRIKALYHEFLTIKRVYKLVRAIYKD
jgi:hypothetical protein